MLLHWYEALRAEYGVIIQTDNPALTIQHLYAARRKAGDAELQGLSIVQSPTNPSELWIIKNAKKE